MGGDQVLAVLVELGEGLVQSGEVGVDVGEEGCVRLVERVGQAGDLVDVGGHPGNLPVHQIGVHGLRHGQVEGFAQHASRPSAEGHVLAGGLALVAHVDQLPLLLGEQDLPADRVVFCLVSAHDGVSFLVRVIGSIMDCFARLWGP